MLRCHRFVAVLAIGCAAAFTSVTVLAQGSTTELAAYMSGLRIDRSMLAGPLASAPRSAMRLGSGESSQEPREINLVGNGVVLEMGRTGPDGQYVRPRVVIGLQSAELRSWMRAAGLEPERCMLPQLRGRVKRDPETGKTGAAVLMSARCTFY